MGVEIDNSLITEFRKKANDNIIFRNAYKNIGGKNKWNVICSSMDWITVASRGINKININDSKFGMFSDIQSLNLMQYVITVDIMLESIKQLFRVLFGHNYKYPLIDDNSIFMQSISDDIYFKHLRAAFGTHPVNLNSLDGINCNKDESFYASWSSGNFMSEEYDYIVNLYSNDPSKDNQIELGINMDKVNLYFESRYNLLKLLSEKLDLLNEEISEKYRKELIESSNDIVSQIEILVMENNRRYGEGYGFYYQLNYIYTLIRVYTEFQTKDAIVKGYIEFLKGKIPHIKTGLQDLTRKEDNLFLRPINLAGNYETEKIYSYLTNFHPIGEVYYYKLIEKGFLPEFLMTSNNMDLKELFLDAYLFKESNLLEGRVNIVDILKGDFRQNIT
jgi:hypothetical protein